MRKIFGFALIGQALISIVVLSPIGSMLVIMLAITGFGIPIALLLMAIPTIFLFLSMVFIISRVMGASGWFSYAAASLLSLAVLLGIPYAANRQLEQYVQLLAATDRDEVGTQKITRLAIIEPEDGYTKGPSCGGLCQRILLNENVSELIIAVTKDGNYSPEQKVEGLLYRRYRSEKCPAINYAGVNDFRPKDEIRKLGDKSAKDLLVLQAMKGNCVGVAAAPADSADAIVARAQTRQGKPGRPPGWNIWARDIKSGALTMWQKRDGVFRVGYRKTVIKYQPLFPILAPTKTGIAFNGFSENRSGFYRVNAVSGAESIYVNAPDVGQFLIDRVHFDLALHDNALCGKLVIFSVLCAARP